MLFKDKEKEALFKEIEKRKLRAEELGIPKLFEKIYFSEIEHYPSWIKKDATKNSVYPLINEAVELENSYNNETYHGYHFEKIKIVLKEKEYVFSFQEKDAYKELHGILEIFIGNKKVLRLETALDDCGWHVFDIAAFIEGDWINDFQELGKGRA